MAGRVTALIIVAVMLGGCATYDSRFRYQPRPVTVQMTGEPASEANPLLVSATVVGVRTEHAKQQPETVEVRLLVENRTMQQVTFRPGSLELLGADLQRLPEPMTEPAEPLVLEPGQRGTVTAYFPYDGADDESYDLSGLSLRWTADIGGQSVTRAANFTLRYVENVHHHYYHDPWHGWGPGFRFGVGAGHRF